MYQELKSFTFLLRAESKERGKYKYGVPYKWCLKPDKFKDAVYGCYDGH